MNGQVILGVFLLVHSKEVVAFSSKTSQKIANADRLTSQYTNTTNEGTTDSTNPCFRLNTCAYSQSVYVPNCYCDELCHLYHDCCIDHKTDQHNASQLNDENEEDKGSGLWIPDLECKVLYGRDVGVHLVTRCPGNFKNWRKNITTMKTFRNEIIVTGEDGFVYENENIAICNNVTKFETWKVNFDLSFCFDKIDLKDASAISAEEIALYYYQLGCDFKVIPPKELLPRFCISFGHCDNSSGGIRIPVITIDATYYNEMCCKQFVRSSLCTDCHTSGVATYDKLDVRFGNSMVAMFKFKSENRMKSSGQDVLHSTSTLKLRNAILRQLCVASVDGEIDVPQWTRAFLFYKLSIETALKEFDVVFKNIHSFSYSKCNGSNKSKLYGNTYLQIKNDLESYRAYQEMETWLIDHHVTYIESSETTTTVFNISSKRIGQGFDYCSWHNHTCTVLPMYGRDSDSSETFMKNQMLDLRVSRTCKHIQGMMKLADHQRSLIITCTRLENLPSDGVFITTNIMLLISMFITALKIFNMLF